MQHTHTHKTHTQAHDAGALAPGTGTGTGMTKGRGGGGGGEVRSSCSSVLPHTHTQHTAKSNKKLVYDSSVLPHAAHTDTHTHTHTPTTKKLV